MQYYRTIERTVPLGSASQLRIFNRRGELTIFGEDREDISLTAQLAVNASTEREGNERLDAIDIPIGEEDGVVYIGAPEPDGHHIGIAMLGLRLNLLAKHDDHGVRMEIVLRVPRRCAIHAEQHAGPLIVTGVHAMVDVAARSGPIDVHGIEGRVDVRARSGAVEVRDVTGNVGIASRSGRVEVEHVRGDLGLSSRSGHVSVSGVEGIASLKTQSGRITFERVRGDAQVRSLSGPIEFRGPLPASLDIEAHSASVRIAVERGTPFFIDAETYSGSIRSELEVSEQPEPRPGAPSMRVRTHSGAIRILAA